MATTPTGGHSPAEDNRLILADIATATKAAADAVSRLLSVARFGPTAAGGPSGIPGVTGPSAGGGAAIAGAVSQAARAFAERQSALHERAGAYSQIGLGGIG